MSKPYLSIVITSRNDDYQGESLKRMEMAINMLILQTKRYHLKTELIVVDWNPPQDKPLLKDIITLPNNIDPLIIRFIVVPPSIHQKYICSKKINIVVAAALNVGIRRAQGEFILPTSADIFFSDELVNFLALEKLEKQFFYRANRCDIRSDILNCSTLKEQMNFYKNNIIKVYERSDDSCHGLASQPALHTNGGDFILIAKEHWYRLHGWPELNNLGLFCDGLICYMTYASGLKEKILEMPMCVYHIDHENRWRKLKKHPPKSKILRLLLHIFYYHLPLSWQKFVLGENLKLNYRHLRAEYKRTVRAILTKRKSYVYNDDNWGMPKENLKEFIIT